MSITLAMAARAEARPTRPRFEPTDLELEDTGVAELDLQIGPAFGDGPGGNRMLLPDFEFDLGLLPNVELDIDGAFSLDHVAEPSSRAMFSEALWTCVKLGVWDSRGSVDGPNVYAVGLQAGPRIPILDGHGIGYGALALFGLTRERYHLALNLGFILDPGDTIHTGRPTSFVGGLDADISLDRRGAWSLLGEIGGVYYTSRDPNDITAAVGVAWHVGEMLDLSAIVLGGAFSGADRLAVLVGASPKIALW
ncbi:hypothetical protein LZC95_47740 [Pendulispora brunnea]|uniref:Uncharacterized protein n=1 Tax=Pendulispora brunnea TaxID=2905690 RepID=A0ABZ2K5Z9_9BACT